MKTIEPYFPNTATLATSEHIIFCLAYYYYYYFVETNAFYINGPPKHLARYQLNALRRFRPFWPLIEYNRAYIYLCIYYTRALRT